MTKTLKEHLDRISSLGGQVKGKSKRRGDAAHYQKLSKLAAKARRKK